MYSDGGSSASPPPVQVAGSNNSKEMRAVLLALKSYAASSLFDTGKGSVHRTHMGKGRGTGGDALRLTPQNISPPP